MTRLNEYWEFIVEDKYTMELFPLNVNLSLSRFILLSQYKTLLFPLNVIEIYSSPVSRNFIIL
jgi:hypothetical protein